MGFSIVQPEVRFGQNDVPLQIYINKALVSLVDIIYIVYLNNILIYSKNLDKYTNYIHQVLKQLQ